MGVRVKVGVAHWEPEAVGETERLEPLTAPLEALTEAVGQVETEALPLPAPPPPLAEAAPELLRLGVALEVSEPEGLCVADSVPLTLRVGLREPEGDSVAVAAAAPFCVGLREPVSEGLGLSEALMVPLLLPAAPCKVEDIEGEALLLPPGGLSEALRVGETLPEGEALRLGVPPTTVGVGGWLGVTDRVLLAVAPLAWLGEALVLALSVGLAESGAREGVARPLADCEAVPVMLPVGEAEGEALALAQDVEEEEAPTVGLAERLAETEPVAHWLPLGEAPGEGEEPACGEPEAVVEPDTVREGLRVLEPQGVAPLLAVLLPEVEAEAEAAPLLVAPAAGL